MEIVEFLKARLDEDERDATAATEAVADKHWHQSLRMREVVTRTPQLSAEDIGVFGVVRSVDPWDEPGPDPVLEHVARHDPARVLADVAAKRAIVEWQISRPHRGQVTDYDGCDSRRDSGAEDSEGNTIWEATGLPCSCGRDEAVVVVLGYLAAPYADHPDYDEAWRP